MTEELDKYVREHTSTEGDYLYRLYRATNIHTIHGRMASGHLQGRLLKMLVQMVQPKNVLEVGTFSGYSALCLAEGLPDDGHLYTFEINDVRQWGIGKQKSNNGLLILFVADQRKVRFTVGYGLEGTMTDAMSKRIQMQRMVPRFKACDWDGGMVDGVRAAAQVLDGSMQPEPTDDDEDMLVGIIALLIIIGIAIFVIFLVGEAQRCPKCRKKGVKRVAQQVLRLSNGRRVRRTTFLCPHCGHTFTRDENIDDSGNAAAFIAGAMLGGMGRRGGGGGFIGGRLGGGSTGRGGSTSGWEF